MIDWSIGDCRRDLNISAHAHPGGYRRGSSETATPPSSYLSPSKTSQAAADLASEPEHKRDRLDHFGSQWTVAACAFVVL